MSLKQLKIADLDALKLESSQGNSSKEATIFLHGAGANMQDLAPLADYLPSLKTHDLYFLNAPFDMMPPYPMHIWFNVGELVEKMAGGFNEDIVKSFVPTRIDEGRKYLKDAMNNITSNYDSINLIGFSQGGMMAFDYSLEESKIKRIILLSTSICDYPTLETKISKLNKNVKIFQSHGTRDDILPYKYGTYLTDFIRKNGIDVDFHEFNDGHTIPLEILRSLDEFVAATT